MSENNRENNDRDLMIGGLKVKIAELEAALKTSSKSELLYLSAMHQTNLILRETDSLSGLMETILNHAATLVNSKNGFIHLMASNYKIIQGIGCFAGEYASLLDNGTFMDEDVWKSGNSILVEDYDNWQLRCTVVPKGMIKSLCIIPVRHNSSIRGGIVLARLQNQGSFKSDADLEALERFVEIAVPAFENYQTILDRDAQRVKTERVLKESEDKFRILFEDSHDAIYMAGQEDRFDSINPFAVGLLGYSREELIGKDVSIIYQDPDERAKVRAEIDRNGFIQGCPIRLKRKDGTYIECLETSHARHSEEGSILFYQGTFRDITDRLKSEAALRESELKFRTLAEQAQLGIMIIKDDRCVFANETCAWVMNVSRDELLTWDKNKLASIIRQDDQELIVQKIFETKGNDKEIPIECEIRTGKGDLKCLSVSSKWIDFEGGTAIELVMLDTTEHRRIEEELRFRYALEKLLATTSNRFMDLEPNEMDKGIQTTLQEVGDFADADRSWLALFNEDSGKIDSAYEWSAEHFSKNMSSFVGEDAALISDMIKKYEREDAVYRPSIETSEDLDSSHPVIQDETKSVIIVPIDFKGTVHGYLGIEAISVERDWSEDIVTLLKMIGEIFVSALERRRVSQALDVSEAQFRQAQKMEAIGQLAGGIAHDFNNLLTVIAGQAELMNIGLSRDDPMREGIEKIHEVTDRAAVLIKQMLAFSRLQTLQPKVIDLSDLLNEMRQTILRLIGEHIIFEYHPQPDLWKVKVDPGQFQQVIVNLAVNARDAMPTGGTINITISNLEPEWSDRHQFDTITRGEYIRISFEDDGQGMSEEIKARIFDPFYSTKEQGKGTGLGLSMVYGFLKQSNGYIRVESELGKGTRFTILLPRAIEAVSITTKVSSKNGLVGGSEKILVVEDEESVRQVAVSALKLIGYEVEEAASGLEALKICENLDKPFDMVLSDVIMPGMSGPKLVQKLLDMWPGLRILFMSGYAAEELTEEGFSHGNATYIQKPFRLSVLAREVREILDRPVSE